MNAPSPAVEAQSEPPRPGPVAETIQTLLRERRHDELVALAERTVAAAPENAEAWNLLAVALRRMQRHRAAIACLRRALDLDPGNPTAMLNLGGACGDTERPAEAAIWYRKVLERQPSAIVWTHLGVALHETGDPAAALDAYDTALALDPAYARCHVERAHALLRLGRFAEGWEEFEWRWRLDPADRPALPSLASPRWTGEPLDGPLLVLPEQGFGDTILCARFLAALRGRVKRVILACKPELLRLFSTLEGIDALVPTNATPPPHAAHIPLMSLPRLTMRPDEAPPPPARLHVPAESRAKLAGLIGPNRGRLNVGIVWSGSVTFKANAQRATTLDRFLSFAEVPGLRLFSLQKGPPAAELNAAGLGSLIVDLGRQCRDFADKAAAVEQLDLVVMTDSSVAHLAGSLGRPIWNLLPHAPYWLYGMGGAQTPWYPSMRMFRQDGPGGWDRVFEAAGRAAMERAAHADAGT
jgi:tetratricopeptide (TPR) repeat protein